MTAHTTLEIAGLRKAVKLWQSMRQIYGSRRELFFIARLGARGLPAYLSEGVQIGIGLGAWAVVWWRSSQRP
jgi:hypothetical protein